MPSILKVCPVVGGLKVSQYTVKNWERLHDSLDLPTPATASVEPSVLGAVTHKDTQNDQIPRNPRGEIHSLGKMALQKYKFGLRIDFCVLYLSLQVQNCVSREAVPADPDGSRVPTQLPPTPPRVGAELEGSIETLSLNMILFLFLHRKFPLAACVLEETISSTAAQHVSV